MSHGSKRAKRTPGPDQIPITFIRGTSDLGICPKEAVLGRLAALYCHGDHATRYTAPKWP